MRFEPEASGNVRCKVQMNPRAMENCIIVVVNSMLKQLKSRVRILPLSVSGKKVLNYLNQNGKKDKSKKKQKKKEMIGSSNNIITNTTTTSSSAEANLVERIALDLDELDLAEVSELVNNSGSEEEKSKKSNVVQALAAGAEVIPSEAGKVCQLPRTST